jgi:hypothetical protein
MRIPSTRLLTAAVLAAALLSCEPVPAREMDEFGKVRDAAMTSLQIPGGH